MVVWQSSGSGLWTFIAGGTSQVGYEGAGDKQGSRHTARPGMPILGRGLEG